MTCVRQKVSLLFLQARDVLGFKSAYSGLYDNLMLGSSPNRRPTSSGSTYSGYQNIRLYDNRVSGSILDKSTTRPFAGSRSYDNLRVNQPFAGSRSYDNIMPESIESISVCRPFAGSRLYDNRVPASTRPFTSLHPYDNMVSASTQPFAGSHPYDNMVPASTRPFTGSRHSDRARPPSYSYPYGSTLGSQFPYTSSIPRGQRYYENVSANY